MTEADLRDLGIHRISVPIPFPQAGGPVNVYLVEEAGGGLLMWDSGLGTPEAQAALEEGFRRLGRSPREVTKLLVSHGHVDHAGNTRFLQERHGGALPVLGHPADQPKYAAGGATWRELEPAYSAYLARLGVPPEGVEASRTEGDKYLVPGRAAEVRPLADGQVFPYRSGTLRVLHMPGHTPGLVCLHDAEHRLLFSADHLLEKVSPNPLLELGPGGEEGFFRPLSSYLRSIARTRALDLDLVLPGHAAPFADHRAVIDALLPFYAKRQERIRAAVADGPRTPWEIARALFPKVPLQLTFLVVSETVANLEVMEDRGELSRALVDGVYRFG